MSNPISCLHCGTINWELGKCKKCQKEIEKKIDVDDVKEEIESSKDWNLTTEEKEEQRRKALADDPTLRRKFLREKIKMHKQARQRINVQSIVFDEKGKRVKGARQNNVPQITVPKSNPYQVPELV